MSQTFTKWLRETSWRFLSSSEEMCDNFWFKKNTCEIELGKNKQVTALCCKWWKTQKLFKKWPWETGGWNFDHCMNIMKNIEHPNYWDCHLLPVRTCRLNWNYSFFLNQFWWKCKLKTSSAPDDIFQENTYTDCW